MSTPLPPEELSGRCSAIHDDVLYVLSPDSFQSLPLEENATWNELPKGPSLTDPACVRAVPDGDASRAALYVIGGESDDGSYSGLSRFVFEQEEWEELDTPADVMKSRKQHGAAYLNDTQSILVYAGSQPSAPSDTSSQTFVIHLEEPHNIDSFTARAGPETFVPAVSQPILEPWNSSHAVLVGGTEVNKAVFLFEPNVGWQQYGTSLADSLESGIRGTIVTGSDGSKVLETYDMSMSPNEVSQLVLQDASGQPAAVGQRIGGSSRKRKRDLTLADWPEYNSTNAPTATRSEYSLASDGKGRTVCAGGNADSPLAMFDQTDNEWIDTSEFFNRKQQEPLQPISTSTGSPTVSVTTLASSSASATAAAGGGGGDNKERTLRTLGITLGVLCGIAAIFIAALLWMRWRTLKQKKQEGYLGEKDPGQDKNRMSFADRGASFMKEAGGSVNDLLAPPGKDRHKGNSPGSHNSLALIAGKLGANKHNGSNHNPKASYESTSRLVKDRHGNMEMMEIDGKNKTPAATSKPVPGDGLNVPPPNYGASTLSKEVDSGAHDRSSGWSKYFAASQPGGVSHLPSAYLKPHSSTDGSEYTSGVPSQPSRIPSSVLVPPLDIDFSKTVDGQRLSHVATGSPSFSHSREDLAKRGGTAEMAHGQRGMIEDTADPRDSQTTVGSYTRSEMSSHFSSDYYNNSVNTPWTPFSNMSKGNVNGQSNSRPTSSVYTNSVHESRIPSRGKSAGFFPGSGTSFRPPPLKQKMGHAAAPSADWAAPPNIGQQAQDRDSTVTVFPAGVDNPEAVNRPKEFRKPDLQPPLTSGLKPSDSRESTATVFPTGFDHAGYAEQPKGHRLPEFAPPQPSALGGLSDNRDSTATVFPSGVDRASDAPPPRQQHVPEFAPPRLSALVPPDNRDSTATVFPTGFEQASAGASQPKGPRVAEYAPPQASALRPSESRDSTATVFPDGEGRFANAYHAHRPQESLHQLLPPGLPAPPGVNRDSTATIFPKGVPSAYYANRPKELDRQDENKPPMSEDISWLNLGLGGNRI